MSTNGSFDSLIGNLSKNIEDIYKRITPHHEFEFMFFN